MAHVIPNKHCLRYQAWLKRMYTSPFGTHLFLHARSEQLLKLMVVEKMEVKVVQPTSSGGELSHKRQNLRSSDLKEQLMLQLR
jgi:hypothetical protein